MKVLVLGGTGTVGSEVARLLAARGEEVHVLTRQAAKADALPPGARAEVGDLQDPEAVRRVFRGMDAAFLLNGLGTAETHEGLMAVNGAMLNKVGRVVYMSVHHVDRAPHLPHFGAKIPIEIAVQRSGIPYTILRPNNFYQNDYWFKDALLQHGVYPQPIGDLGISRVDVRDIAEMAVAALTAPGHEGRSYDVVGPEVLTGAATAEIWSRALGRPVAYGGNDLDAYETQARQWLPPFLAFDFRYMYDFFQKEGLQAGPQDVETMTRVLGHPPRRFEDFARETARAWKA